MKNLKIKFRLFSLLAILAASVFLTSCEQEQITDLVPQQEMEHKNQSTMMIPLGIATDSEEDRDEYIKNATPELIDKMIENARVAYYLMSINKLDDLVAQMSYGDFFCDLDLTSLLTEVEITGLQNYEVSPAISSRCCYWVRTVHCHPPSGDCYVSWEKHCP